MFIARKAQLAICLARELLLLHEKIADLKLHTFKYALIRQITDLCNNKVAKQLSMFIARQDD